MQDLDDPNGVRNGEDGLAAPEFVLLEKRIAVFAASHVDARAQCMKAGTRDGKEIIGKKFNLQHGV